MSIPPASTKKTIEKNPTMTWHLRMAQIDWNNTSTNNEHIMTNCVVPIAATRTVYGRNPAPAN